MKCNEFERIIFLYEESDASERALLEEHMKSCAACREAFAQAQVYHSSIRPAYPAAELENAAAFTANVMGRITSAKQPSALETFSAFLSASWLRNAMAAACIALMTLFIYEYNYGAGTVEQHVQAPANETTILNTTAFFQERQQRPAREGISLLACLKACEGDSRQPECEECLFKNFNN